jgi:DNA-binding NarL/FixJ family response regulator
VVVVPAPTSDSSPQSTEASPLRILIIHSQPLLVAALGRLLSAAPLLAEVSTEARSDAGLDVARRGDVQIVLCGLRCEPLSGPEVAAALRVEAPLLPVVLLGDAEDEGLLVSALRSPAAGLFSHDVGVDEFIAGIGVVLSGHRAIGDRVMGMALKRIDQAPPGGPVVIPGHLSPTELEILTMLGKAESVPNIATQRGISRKTVRNHLAKIYRKLELHGRTDAMLWAARMGLTGSE